MSLTLWVMLIVTFGLIIFDVYIIVRDGEFESISAYVIRGSKRYPLVVLAFGILLGHLFWSMDSFKWMPKEELVQKCKVVLETQEIGNN